MDHQHHYHLCQKLPVSLQHTAALLLRCGLKISHMQTHFSIHE